MRVQLLSDLHLEPRRDAVASFVASLDLTGEELGSVPYSPRASPRRGCLVRVTPALFSGLDAIQRILGDRICGRVLVTGSPEQMQHRGSVAIPPSGLARALTEFDPQD